MALELVFNVKGNATAETKKLQEQLNKLNVTTKKTEDTNKKLDSTFATMTKSVIGLGVAYKTLDFAYTSIIQNGLSYNRVLENQSAGITALVSATSLNIDSLGNQLTAQQKFNLATKESVGIMSDLEKANARLPTTLKETASIYKSLLPSFKEAGASQEELLELTEKFAIVSNVANIEMNSLVATVDSVASGTLVASSDLGKFLNSMGLTNKVLSESNDVAKLVIETFKDFKTLDTQATAVSNLEDEWDKLTGTLTEDLFAKQTLGAKRLTTFLGRTNLALEDFLSNINKVQDVYKIDEISTLERELLQLKEAYDGNTKSIWQSASNYKAEREQQELLIKTTERRIARLKEADKVVEMTLVARRKTAPISEVFPEAEFDKAFSGLSESIQPQLDAITADIKPIEVDIVAVGLDTFTDVIAGATNALTDFYRADEEFKERSIKLEEQKAEAMIKADGDTFKIKQINKKFDAEMSKSKTAQQEAEIAGYSSLANVIASAFEKGSKEAIAFSALQATLGIASSYTAIANAWALPFPSNIPAVATVTSAVTPLIAQLGAMGGSGGGGALGGGANSYAQTQESNIKSIEQSNQPIIDRLDRQIELAEALNLQGSAGTSSLLSTDITFSRDYQIGIEKIIGENLSRYTRESYSRITESGGIEQFTKDLRLFEEAMGEGFDFIPKLEESLVKNKKFYSDFSQLREAGDSLEDFHFNMLNFLSTASELENYSLFLGDEAFAKGRLEDFQKSVAIMQEVNSDYILNLLDTINSLSDASDSFKDVFDDITGTAHFMERDLRNAFEDVDNLLGDNKFPDYLKAQVEAIEGIEEQLGSDLVSLFLSNDASDLRKQAIALQELSAFTGVVFKDGASDALDYLDSIELVGEAMATSISNIKDWQDSFKSSDTLAKEMAQTLNVELATNFIELGNLSRLLANDIEGMTDADLELLEANRELLESTDETTSHINSLSGSLNSIHGVLDRLRGTASSGSLSIDKYHASMDRTLELSKTSNYEEFNKSLSETIKFSNELLDTSNFASGSEMRRAQGLAASQFDNLEVATLDQIDYLALIEENTRLTADTLLSDQYQKILGREADQAGADYWAGQIASGAIASNQIGIAIGAAGVENQEISRADYVSQLYTQGLGRTPSAEEVDYWTNKSETPTTELGALFGQIDPEFQSFAVGTPNVPHDMLANIHKGEGIIPETFMSGVRSGDITIGGSGDNDERLKTIEAILTTLTANNIRIFKLLERIERNGLIALPEEA